MKIRSAEYITSAVKPDQYPAGSLPEIALAGRSNVGKSSLINALVQRRGLARVSQQPGKTQTLNFYLINNSIYLVDFPGYGFARVPKEVKRQWATMIEQYLFSRENLTAVMQLVDIRHPPSKEDVEMFEFLKKYQHQIILVCTKADKISKGRWQHHLKVIKQHLQVRPEDLLIPCSAVTGAGIEALRDNIAQLTHLGEASSE